MAHNHDGHRQRLKERYLKYGIDGFQQHEILELLLFFSVFRKNTNEIGHDLISRFGGIAHVFEAPFEELVKVDGISEHSATLIKLIPDLTRTYLEDKNKTDSLFNSREVVVNYLYPKFIGRLNEMLVALFVDNRGKLIEYSVISEGEVSATQVDLRKIMKLCMSNNATRVFIAHNHPRGMPLPSAEDIDATRMIYNALADVKVKLVDHLVFGEDGSCVSVSKSAEYKRVFGLAQDQKEIDELYPDNLDGLFSDNGDYDM